MNDQRRGFPVVGIGASAGGVEALQVLFRAMPDPAPEMAFVVVTHVGASHDSALPEILRDCTSMPVVPARDGEVVQPGHAYVLPNDALITLCGGRLVLRRQLPENQRERQPIDLFFASLAEDQGEAAIGVVLSGSGSDGTLGLKAIKEAGGLTIAQGSDGTVPRYPSMPNSAVAVGVVDLVLPSGQIPGRLAELARHPDGLDVAAEDDRRAGGANQAAARQDEISGILRTRVGHDFAGYKAKTFFRRVQRRMQVRSMPDMDAYVALLRQDEDEAANLFRDLLISVTGFFRDTDAFAALAQRVFPAIFKGRGADDTVRIWVPGCATGEEAYSLAILAHEQIAGRPDSPRIQIFATDIDEAALSVARGGRYPASMMDNVSPERLARFFVTDGATYAVSRETRDLCVFSSHSVIRDAPFSRIDMVSCRNLLIYMGGQLQEQVIPLFHYALRPNGYLFLGVSETTTRHDDLFKPDDKAHRIFQRRDSLAPGLPVRAQSLAQGTRRSWPSMPTLSRPQIGGATELHQMAHAFAAEHFAPPHLLVNATGDIVYQTANLGKYLEPSAGIPSRQLLAMARRGLRLDLRSALRQAIDQRRPATRSSVEVEFSGQRQMVALTVAPLPTRDGHDPLFMVVFADVQPPVPRPDIAPAATTDTPRDQIIELLEHDLRDARDRLQSMAEEYETATEELKSANEEMVSVNEELQSINEELETSKEELQSVNEELRTTNLELSNKIEQLDLANTDLRNLFDSTQVATVFLDRHLVIRNFTPAVTGIFDLVHSDRGRPLSSFTSYIDGVDFGRETRRVLNERVPVERRVTARGGAAHYLMRMLPYTTADSTVDGVVVTFFDITQVVEGELLGTLVDELNHRVRNMLQVVSAVATHTLRRATNLKDFGVAFTGRIRALARAHELVSLGGWTDVPLQDLIEKELLPYAVGPGRLVMQGPPAWLTPKAALSVGMILHEMATNAAKYGALSTETGQVTIEWSTEGFGTAARLVVRWLETGGPKVHMPPERRGFGSELIERQLRHDLGGTFKADFHEAGLRSRIELPLTVLAKSGKLSEGRS
ncbi:chemotaxis protein CheB [Belnapia sp. F-4-1]|uniref:chemotaxis protein CheB n=1 Tax=Belnapia sp. F-4-1 TaxID=1545443 RepID=UPI0005BD39EB|nr:chemotaxis protein CheB [Belnapia sp. F-4-1]